MKIKIGKLKVKPLVFECDGEDKVEKLLVKLGVKKDDLEKLKSGSIEIDEIVGNVESRFEDSISKRIASSVEETKKREIFAGVYAKEEKRICKMFDLNHEDYKAVDERDRIDKMLEDARKKYEDSIKETESKYKNADTDKIKELETKYQKQLDDANKLREEAVKLAEQSKFEAESKLSSYKKEQAKGSKISTFLDSIKNPAYAKEVMLDSIKVALMEYDIDVEESESGRVFVLDKEGKRIKSAKVASENMTIDELLESVAAKRGFEAQNRFGQAGTKPTAPQGASSGEAWAKLIKRGLSADYLRVLQEKGQNLDEILQKMETQK